MKICCQINSYQSEEYLKYVLDSIYDFADRIVIIDGAFNQHIKPEISTDKTIDIIHSYPDIEFKIKFEAGPANSQVEQRQKAIKHIGDCDWLMIVDDDEIYKPEDLKKIREFLSKTKEHAFHIVTMNFVNSFDWYYRVSNMRVWRVIDGMYYHGPNSITHRNKKIAKRFQRKNCGTIPDVDRFHYTFVRDISRIDIKQNQIKQNFPWMKNGKFVKRDIQLSEFKGEHPDIMKDHPYSKIKWRP